MCRSAESCFGEDGGVLLDFNRHGIRNIIIIMILVFSAITCRMITKYDIVTGFFNMFFSLVRSGIYIGMILAWGVSVKRRILHSPQVSACYHSAAFVLDVCTYLQVSAAYRP